MIISWWTRAPNWVRLLVLIGALVPFLLAVPYAMWSRPEDPFQAVAALSGIVGARIGARFRDPEFWALTKPDRVRVRDAVRTGEPTRERQLDTLAAGFLVRQAKGDQGSRTCLCLFVVVVQAITVIAAARSGQPVLWVAGLPVSLTMLLAYLALRKDPPQARLDRFTASVRGGP